MSDNVWEMAAEGQINALVKEYLEFRKFKNSTDSFVKECSQSRSSIGVLAPSRTQTASQTIQKSLMRAFQEGSADTFFELWDTHVPVSCRGDDPAGQRVEFYLYIYYALLHRMNLKSHSAHSSQREAPEEGMARLKEYLGTRGQALSQTAEFLPYYALPFIANPENHPSYRDLFQPEWSAKLGSDLEALLTSAFNSAPEPRLNELYTTASNIEVIKEQAKRKATDADKRTAFLSRRCEKLQSDYFSLIRISADLIDALEATIQGDQVSPEHVQSLCQQLFATQLRRSASLDLRRPGTASKALRASIGQPSSHQVNTARSNSIVSSRHSDRNPASASLPIDQLHFEKVKYIISEGEGQSQALLLQALRWKLTRSSPAERDLVIAAFITHDLLGCLDSDLHKDSVMNLFSSPNQVVRQYTSRLFNAVASLKEGRFYLSQNRTLLQALVENLRSEDKDSITRENVLGALQKLSLRRGLQSDMIREGVLQWLVQVLEDFDGLSDYTLEYSVALMMNLCLRTAGKQKCAEDPGKVLQVLSDLLGHDNLEIRPYVNGALYSILGLTPIKSQARKMGMEDILKCFIKEDQPDMNRQLDFIIRQLHAEENSDDILSDDEDEEEEDEDQDAMEADLDKAEVLRVGPGELCGEALLAAHYSLPLAHEQQGRRAGGRGASAGGRAGPGGRLQEEGQRPLIRAATPNQLRLSTPYGQRGSGDESRPHTQSSLGRIRESSPPMSHRDLSITPGRNQSQRDTPRTPTKSKSPAQHQRDLATPRSRRRSDAAVAAMATPRGGESEAGTPRGEVMSTSEGVTLRGQGQRGGSEMQRPSSETIDRPYTTTKSRPSTTGDGLPSQSHPDDGVMERAVSEERNRSQSQQQDHRQRSSRSHYIRGGTPRKGAPDYQVAFAARPRIARTPEGPRSVLGNMPPVPTFSDNLPSASPRPNSSGSKNPHGP